MEVKMAISLISDFQRVLGDLMVSKILKANLKCMRFKTLRTFVKSIKNLNYMVINFGLC